jgi:hypothetical protein
MAVLIFCIEILSFVAPDADRVRIEYGGNGVFWGTNSVLVATRSGQRSTRRKPLPRKCPKLRADKGIRFGDSSLKEGGHGQSFFAA